MLGALIIVFREVVEAGLVVGIVLAATRGIEGRGWWVSLGVVSGVLGASVVAAFAGAISDAFAGSGQELLNAGVLLVAVVSLTWHNVWMAEHGRELVAELRQVGSDVIAGVKPLTALAVVVFVAVMREGSEIVLFLYGIVVAGTSMMSLLTGGLLGLLGGAAMTGLSYFGLIAIPTRYIFQVTSVLLALLAAGMAAQAIHFLHAAGVVTAFQTRLWDTSWLLSDQSIAGRMLHVLVGYTAKPTGLQLLVYLVTLAAIALLMRFARSTREPRPARSP
ncbi:MAG: FTR1 family iron permease [Actinomycetota bacterium]